MVPLVLAAVIAIVAAARRRRPRPRRIERPPRPPPTGSATASVAAAAAKPYRLDLADRKRLRRPGELRPVRRREHADDAQHHGRERPHDADPGPPPGHRPDLSGPTREGFKRKGASVRGWTDGLNQLDAGPYRLVGTDTLAGGAPARRPVDPRDGQAGRSARLVRPSRLGDERLPGHRRPPPDDDFQVTKAIVLDPLYPYGSSKWGPSPQAARGDLGRDPRQAVRPAPAGTWAGAPTGVAGAIDDRARRQIRDRHAVHPDRVRPRPPRRRLSATEPRRRPRTRRRTPRRCATFRR